MGCRIYDEIFEEGFKIGFEETVIKNITLLKENCADNDAIVRVFAEAYEMSEEEAREQWIKCLRKIS